MTKAIEYPTQSDRTYTRWDFSAWIWSGVSLTTVFDVATQESWSRYVMFRDMFSSAN
jgi:hypothetical protein